jgi:signal transduction histidine kinase
LGAALLALAPLGGAAFVHFAVGLGGRGRTLVPWTYGLGALATLGAWTLGTGRFLPWPGIGWIFHYEGAGLAAGVATLALAAVGHGLLARAWIEGEGLARRQAALAFLFDLLGLVPLIGLAFPLLDWRVAPWPLLALPVYPLLLAYAMARYRLMAANRWAARAVAWGALVVLAALASALFAGGLANRGGAPFAWTALALLAGLALAEPLRRLADRLVYPGGVVEPATLARWRRALAEAPDEVALETRARTLLADHLGMADGDPTADLEGAPPGARRAAGVMAEALSWAREDLTRHRAFADRERLAELGLLSATVAHDLRNPMNTLSMAVADLPAEAKAVARRQLDRMDSLVRDLLDYGKPWALAPEPVDAMALVGDLDPEVDRVPATGPTTLRADPARLRQALANLLDNARAAGGRVQVAMTEEAGTGAPLLHLRDDGQGIPEDIRPRLFQPFISRGERGTGLGLAIVAKVMAAHGGSVAVTEPPAGWSTQITLRFPPEDSP